MERNDDRLGLGRRLETQPFWRAATGREAENEGWGSASLIGWTGWILMGKARLTGSWR